eukprot:CAMPEP_0173406586 /NCGR_PEP_ID=MMETSP1356-20130122/64943_1 /TAXON_ID=77927 ORGANISM="Hemiselmis virescens, Strain PCC157" /NCGR_SAMPLE_ID=MMETSP1356 /ASSEMBLY_ACC=CAM_ASM_000847 /LENGTH=123 /DNA_ID=CAMNT_0014367601 /DNA_START=70 /DNA_END=442 /DNA_ORIENTATION=-
MALPEKNGYAGGFGASSLHPRETKGSSLSFAFSVAQLIYALNALWCAQFVPWHSRKFSFYLITDFIKKEKTSFKEDMSVLLGLLSSGAIKPKVTSLPLASTADALALLDDKKSTGKVVVECWK